MIEPAWGTVLGVVKQCLNGVPIDGDAQNLV
jgi:hypothetical protein